MGTKIMYKILFGTMMILLFVVGMYIGAELQEKDKSTDVISATNNNVKIEVQPYNDEIVETEDEELINVSVKYTDVYPDCGHTIESNEQYDNSRVTDIKDEIESKDLGYRLIGIQDGMLIYQKVHNGMCLNHYKVLLEDNAVKIYRINQLGEFEFYQDTEITIETIREGIKEQLEKGIEVDELEELLLLIEDIES